LTGDIFKSLTTRQAVTLSLILGFTAALFPGPLAAVLMSAALLLYTRRLSQRWDDRWLFRILAAGFILRVAAIALMTVISTFKGDISTLFGDSKFVFQLSRDAYSVYAGILEIDAAPRSLFRDNYGYNFFNWIYGAIYFLIGYSPFLLRLFNSLCGCLVALMVYLITYRVCGRRAPAAWAMGLTMFWPSQILWSVTLLKEPILALYASLIIYLFIEMIKKRRWWYLIPIYLLGLPMGELRFQAHLVMLPAISLSAILFIPRRKIVGVALIVFLGLAGLAVGHSHIKPAFKRFHDRIVTSQIGWITTGGSYYKFLPDRFKPVGGSRETMNYKETTVSICKAVYYYLCLPNPFVKIKKSQVPAVPQMIIWYVFLVFFLPLGVLYLVRHYYRESGIIFIYLLAFTLAMALFSGNEGAVFRHRDMLVPFFFIPISVGLVNLLGWMSLKLRPGDLRPQDLDEGPAQE